MATSALLHLFGETSSSKDGWDAVDDTVTAHPARRPSAEGLAAIVRAAQGRRVALLRADQCSPQLLIELDQPAADVTCLITDAAGGTAGRGAGDLVATLWNSAPAVAAWLCESPLDAGGVVFSAAAVQGPLADISTQRSGDAIARALAQTLTAGGTVAAVVLAEGTVAAVTPPALCPAAAAAERRPLAELLLHLDAGRLVAASPGPDATAVVAGLLLWHDFLEASHEVSQSIEGAGLHRAGDHWHAIMHRREGDYGNAKYWFRRVGTAPLFQTLAERASRLLSTQSQERLLRQLCPCGQWSAGGFVDACEEAARADDAQTQTLLRQLQADEMLLLLHQTVADARR